MTNTVYIATSVDVFIATKDGGIDWLHELPNPTGSDYGFSEFMNRIDAIVMGRKTYQTVLSFDQWPYTKPVFVLSKTLSHPEPKFADHVEIVNDDLKKLIQKLNSRGFKNLYIDGGLTIQSFLKDDLIDELIITRVPILLGEGIALFDGKNRPLKLRHCETQVYDDGLVKSRYVRADSNLI